MSRGGRGRGRGAGNSAQLRERLGTLSAEPLAFASHPPQIFPRLINKPSELLISEDDDNLLLSKRKILDTFQESRFFLNLPVRENRIERYSDKYTRNIHKRDNNISFGKSFTLNELLLLLCNSFNPFSLCSHPDWRLFPHELAPVSKRKSAPKKPAKTPRVQLDALKDEDEEKAEKKSETSDTENENENEEENALAEDDVMGEEENDYMQSYFDNGEAYGEGSDDNMDEGPTY